MKFVNILFLSNQKMSEVKAEASPVKQVTMGPEDPVQNEDDLKVNTRPGLEEDEDENWYELRVDGKQPERRANHSSFIVGSKMYIYGGYDMREGPVSTVWSFDLKNVGDLAGSDSMTKLPQLTWQ